MRIRSLALVPVALFSLATPALADIPPRPKPADVGKPKKPAEPPADKPAEPAAADPVKPAEVPAEPAAADPAKPTEPTPAEPAAAEPTEAEQIAAFKKVLGAIEGPAKAAPLGDVATIDVPAGYWFVPKEGTITFDQTIENLHDAKSVGVLVKGDMQTVVYFSFDPIGYVDDDERDLDAGELLTTMREGTTQSNAQRASMGYPAIELIGWVKEPFYNDKTQSLEWALSFREAGQTGDGTANYNTRRLGREGVMSVTLATAPAKVADAVVEMNTNLANFAYVPGKDYASFKEGDRMAEIGLGALVAGGGALALAKVGFFKKFWKILAAGGAALVAGVAKLFGRKKKETDIVASDDTSGT